MSIHIHELSGCSPTPLAHYLKGLGVLRLIAEQQDGGARGWWSGEAFHLATSLDEDALLWFFLEDYVPTPLIAPWNGGSGFYPKDNTRAILAIESSVAPRFGAYRSAISAARVAVGSLEESPKGETKSAFLRGFRQSWRDSSLDWLDSAIVLDAAGDPAYPALLGTGGNDGRLDFTNNFMQRLVELFDAQEPAASPRPESAPHLRSALFGDAAAGLGRASVGQFLPGSAGGANGSIGFTGSAPLNAWDFVLMLEGAVMFVSGVARQARARSLPQAAAPFAVYASAVGSGSAAGSEKNRGEQWMPLWGAPTTLPELKAMLAEGRNQLGERSSTRPLDFGRSIARMGVARGVTAFQRYGYIERNGQANLAVPLDRWVVRPQPHQELLDEVAGWLDRLAGAANATGAPASIGRAARGCEEAMMACCRGADPRRWQALLAALGAAEALLPKSPRFAAEKRLQPLPPLSSGWLAAANDDRPEIRLALAFASQHAPGIANSIDWARSVRRHFLPLDRSGRRFDTSDEALTVSTELVCTGESFEQVAVALIRRRLVEVAQGSLRHLPLLAVKGAEARLDDIAEYIEGRVNGESVLALARPLMALNWRTFWSPFPSKKTAPETLDALSPYSLFRLGFLPRDLILPGHDAAFPVPLDASIFARLAGGNIRSASETALRRLRSSGLRPNLRVVVASEDIVRRLTTSLAFPIRRRHAAAIANHVTRLPARDAERSTEPATQEETRVQ